jgi:hypothetical protein
LFVFFLKKKIKLFLFENLLFGCSLEKSEVPLLSKNGIDVAITAAPTQNCQKTLTFVNKMQSFVFLGEMILPS